MGYHLAGFEVVGVDIEPQPRFPFRFIQMDALEFLDRYLAGEYPEADAFGASPPCQRYGKSKPLAGAHHPMLIGQIRDLLKATGKPYVIENVPGAPLINPVTLNADFFGINVARTRLFECSFHVPFFLLPPPRKAVKMGRPIKDGDIVQPVGHFSGVDYARKQMQCAWMNLEELANAIPPIYTRWIGERLLESIMALT